MGKDLRGQIVALRRRAANVKPTEIEGLALDAGFVHQGTTGSHAVYAKDGYPPNLSIKLHDLGKGLVFKYLKLIEDSLWEEQ